MRRTWKTLVLAAVLALNASGAGAQEQQKQRLPAPPPSPPMAGVPEDELFVTPSGEGGVWEAKGDTFVFVSSEVSFGGKVVKGAPYSAQAVTESVQTLSDGNRIVRKNSASVHRDSEGRTRRDQSLNHFGPYATAGDTAQTSFINDPVAGVNYILDPRSKTARKLRAFEFEFLNEGGAPADVEKSKQRRMHVEERMKVEERVRVEEADRSRFVFERHAPPPPGAEPDIQFFAHTTRGETKTEKLERRTIEGVEAEGRRTVTTIPAGELGNEQPIQIVSERWYSPELQLVVMTRHSDPRFGETTYRLTNISRGEPSSALFQVPADYTLKEMPTPNRNVRRLRRPAPPPQEN